MLIFLLCMMVIVFVIDGIPLIQKKQWNRLIVFAAVIVVSCLLYFGSLAGLPLTLQVLNEALGGLGKSLFG